jgi:2-dehydropantoate 2-reductase
VRIAILGAGAVGGYYGAYFARAGQAVTFVARGTHLETLRAHGITIRGPRGDFAAWPESESDTRLVGAVDLVLLAVKTYDNPTALPLLAPLLHDATIVLTLQNGVDSADETAAVAGRGRVLGGTAYIATALAHPGVIEQTGTHHRVVFGEVFGTRDRVTPRVAALRDVFAAAGLEAASAADARVPLWEKFIYLAPFAGLTGAARLPIGPLWSDEATRALFARACAEVERVARAEGVPVAPDVGARILEYVHALPPTTRSSLLIDLQQGRRIEVEALQGSVCRRARAHGVDCPVMDAFYAVLRPQAAGAWTRERL